MSRDIGIVYPGDKLEVAPQGSIKVDFGKDCPIGKFVIQITTCIRAEDGTEYKIRSADLFCGEIKKKALENEKA